MLMLLSPAKSLDFDTPVRATGWSQASFLAQAEGLVAHLRTLAPDEIASLMSLSDKLAWLNFNRFADWNLPFTLHNARQAVLAFSGDVYEGLSAATLSDDDLVYAQKHLMILSGLYGLLRPLDLIQAYRLEMATKLETPNARDLYAFWKDMLTDAVNERLLAMELPVIVNLASAEYFSAVDEKRLKGRVVQPVFQDWKDGRYRIISFYAKRARGLMTRFAIKQRADSPELLQDFKEEGYAFVPEISDDASWIFRRRLT